jgi:hypothetical protein
VPIKTRTNRIPKDKPLTHLRYGYSARHRRQLTAAAENARPEWGLSIFFGSQLQGGHPGRRF